MEKARFNFSLHNILVNMCIDVCMLFKAYAVLVAATNVCLHDLHVFISYFDFIIELLNKKSIYERNPNDGSRQNGWQ